MKKSIQMIGAIAIVLTVILACKKNNDEPQKEERFSVAIKVAADRGTTENAILVGSKAELKTALSKKGELVLIKKVSTKNNVFVPVLDDIKPVDPTTAYWTEIRTYAAERMAEWQALANQTCTTVIRCITCPNSGGGLFVMYAIEPNSPKCNVLEFETMYNLVNFNYRETELEGEAVANLIKTGK